MRIMIVEDEPPIARLLAGMIGDCCESADIVAVAKDGVQALEKFEGLRPQIVFTDIHMPGMDGVELMGRLRKIDKAVRLVVVSGYDEFEYARGAMRHGAVDYLLKPLDLEKIREVMEKLSAGLDQEMCDETKGDIEKQLKGMSSSLEIRQNCLLMLFCGGMFPVSTDDSMTPGKVLWETEKTGRILENEYPGAWSFQGKSTAERVVVYNLTDPSKQNFQEIAKRIYQIIGSTAEIPVTAVYSEYPVSIQDIGETLRRMRKLLYENMTLWSSSFIGYGPDSLVSHTDSIKRYKPSADQSLARLIACAKAQNGEQIKAELSALFTFLEQESATQKELEYFLMRLTDLSYEQNSEIYISDFKQSMLEAITNCQGLDALRTDIASSLEYYLSVPQENIVNPLVVRIKSFLEENYTQQITNETLSKEFGFVPSYLSNIFRARMGVTPAEYLTGMRITRAKELLDTSPYAYVKEIAEQVGYTDPYYFSKVFKKMTGVSPKEYKLSGR